MASELCSFKGQIFNLNTITRIELNPFSKRIIISFSRERSVDYTGLSDAEYDVMKQFLMSKSTVIDVPRVDIRVEIDRKIGGLRAEIDGNVREVLIPPKPTGENIPDGLPATPRVARTPPPSNGMAPRSRRISVMEYFEHLLAREDKE